jgi:hypothetical protein
LVKLQLPGAPATLEYIDILTPVGITFAPDPPVPPPPVVVVPELALAPGVTTTVVITLFALRLVPVILALPVEALLNATRSLL